MSTAGDQILPEDLLLPFERAAFSAPYREFLSIKRVNTFASIQRLPGFWKRFEGLDSIWLREIENLKQLHDASHIVVIALFIRAYARVRLVMELSFSGCLTEAADLLRGGIESVAQANRILQDPKLAIVWMEKDHGKPAFNAYRDAFERDKKGGLFLGVPALHHYWTTFSEWGHSTVLSVTSRVEGATGKDDFNGQFQFFETDPMRLSPALDAIFDAMQHMEEVLYQGFRARLELDFQLVRMRARTKPSRKPTS